MDKRVASKVGERAIRIYVRADNPLGLIDGSIMNEVWDEGED
jgi:hypothetical protein